MRFALAAACTFVLALGSVLGGFSASSGADATEKVAQHTVASASFEDAIVAWEDDHGNG